MTVVGEHGVGKTALCNRFSKGTFEPDAHDLLNTFVSQADCPPHSILLVISVFLFQDSKEVRIAFEKVVMLRPVEHVRSLSSPSLFPSLS